jgi:hypothetical protein
VAGRGPERELETSAKHGTPLTGLDRIGECPVIHTSEMKNIPFFRHCESAISAAYSRLAYRKV